MFTGRGLNDWKFKCPLEERSTEVLGVLCADLVGTDQTPQTPSQMFGLAQSFLPPFILFLFFFSRFLFCFSVFSFFHFLKA
jgi:hypothetical protein